MLRFKTINLLFAGAFVLLLLASFFFDVSLVVFILIFALWLVITALGSFNIQWNYHLTSLYSNITILEQNIAITFDDGPHPIYTPKVLSLLKQYNAKATFFCIGKNIESHPEIFKQILAEGHTVGNHTYSHSNNFGFFSTQKVTEELLQTNAIAKQVAKLQLKLYRPAFGVTNPNIKKALQKTGLQSIGWNQRSFDTTKLSEEKILKRITKTLKKGDVVLLHDTSAKTVRVLEQLLLFLQTKQMQSVPVDQLLDIEAYA